MHALPVHISVHARSVSFCLGVVYAVPVDRCGCVVRGVVDARDVVGGGDVGGTYGVYARGSVRSRPTRLRSGGGDVG